MMTTPLAAAHEYLARCRPMQTASEYAHTVHEHVTAHGAAAEVLAVTLAAWQEAEAAPAGTFHATPEEAAARLASARNDLSAASGRVADIRADLALAGTPGQVDTLTVELAAAREATAAARLAHGIAFSDYLATHPEARRVVLG